ncbi:MAG: Aspartate aminotransferase [Microgenomates bacterium OLB22]|nr:MAG: Aspartate aminotransferase [Microgenomates bacterium OLB22]
MFSAFLSSTLTGIVLSKIARTIPASPIRKLVPLAQQAKDKGTRVYHLNIGDPDIETPPVMLETLRTWESNPIGYANSQGDTNLLGALLSYYHGLGFDDLTIANLQVTIGGSEGILWTFLTICDPGDQVVTFEPFYTNYASLAIMAGTSLRAVPTSIDQGFHLPERAVIEAAITGKTKAILLCNPSNPTGTVYSREELEMLVYIAKEHDLFLVADEVYREFVYDGREAISLLTFEKELPGKIIIIDSLSKRYSLCGARLGCLISLNVDFMAACLRFGQARLSAGLIDQQLAAALTKSAAGLF